MDNQTKLLLIVAVALVLITYLYNRNPTEKFVSNERQETVKAPALDNSNMRDDPRDVIQPDDESIDTLDPTLLKKFVSKNSAVDGKYKNISYVDGTRNGGIPSDFDTGNSLVESAQKNLINNESLEHGQHGLLQTGQLSPGQDVNNSFTGNDMGVQSLASYTPGVKRDLTTEDIFRAEDYLAKETNNDWFETVQEPVAIRNRHLINVTRPIGVSTISGSLRNPSYDIRGSIPNPKLNPSPWLQSTIEPDINLKSLY